MATKGFYVGGNGPYLYDDSAPIDTISDPDIFFPGGTQETCITQGQMRVQGEPTHDEHVLRKKDLTAGGGGSISVGMPSKAVANLANPTELATISGAAGGTLLAYQSVAGNIDRYNLYAFDSSAVLNSPYVVAAKNGRWVGLGPAYCNAPARFGNATDFSYFEADGTLVSEAGARTYNSVNLPAHALYSTGLTLGTPTGTSFKLLLFPNTGTPYVAGSISLPKYWAENTTIYAFVYWCPTTSASSTVRWQLYYNIIHPGELLTSDTSMGLTASTAGGAYIVVKSELPAITPVSRNIGDQLMFYLYRNTAHAGDVYASDIGLISIEFLFLTDTMGSRTKNAK